MTSLSTTIGRLFAVLCVVVSGVCVAPAFATEGTEFWIALPKTVRMDDRPEALGGFIHHPWQDQYDFGSGYAILIQSASGEDAAVTIEYIDPVDGVFKPVKVMERTSGAAVDPLDSWMWGHPMPVGVSVFDASNLLLQAGGVRDFVLPLDPTDLDAYPNFETGEAEGIEYKGLHITSTSPITVTVYNRHVNPDPTYQGDPDPTQDPSFRKHNDVYRALPVTSLGREYLATTWGVAPYFDGWVREPVRVAIVATEDNTIVRVTEPDEDPRVVLLNTGQVYQYVNASYAIESFLTTALGSQHETQLTLPDPAISVQASRPVAVITGSASAVIHSFCHDDQLLDQALPLDLWGVEYPIPLLPYLAGEPTDPRMQRIALKLIASTSNGPDVYQNDMLGVGDMFDLFSDLGKGGVLQALGQFDAFPLIAPDYLAAADGLTPFGLTLAAESPGAHVFRGDPLQVSLIPRERFTREARITPPGFFRTEDVTEGTTTEAEFIHYISVVVDNQGDGTAPVVTGAGALQGVVALTQVTYTEPDGTPGNSLYRTLYRVPANLIGEPYTIGTSDPDHTIVAYGFAIGSFGAVGYSSGPAPRPISEIPAQLVDLVATDNGVEVVVGSPMPVEEGPAPVLTWGFDVDESFETDTDGQPIWRFEYEALIRDPIPGETRTIIDDAFVEYSDASGDRLSSSYGPVEVFISDGPGDLAIATDEDTYAAGDPATFTIDFTPDGSDLQRSLVTSAGGFQNALTGGDLLLDNGRLGASTSSFSGSLLLDAADPEAGLDAGRASLILDAGSRAEWGELEIRAGVMDELEVIGRNFDGIDAVARFAIDDYVSDPGAAPYPWYHDPSAPWYKMAEETLVGRSLITKPSGGRTTGGAPDLSGYAVADLAPEVITELLSPPPDGLGAVAPFTIDGWVRDDPDWSFDDGYEILLTLEFDFERPDYPQPPGYAFAGDVPRLSLSLTRTKGVEQGVPVEHLVVSLVQHTFDDSVGNGPWALDPAGGQLDKRWAARVPLSGASTHGWHHFQVALDLEDETARVWLNGTEATQYQERVDPTWGTWQSPTATPIPVNADLFGLLREAARDPAPAHHPALLGARVIFGTAGNDPEVFAWSPSGNTPCGIGPLLRLDEVRLFSGEFAPPADLISSATVGHVLPPALPLAHWSFEGNLRDAMGLSHGHIPPVNGIGAVLDTRFSARSSTPSFPAEAFAIAGDNRVDIVDAQSHEVWLSLRQDTDVPHPTVPTVTGLSWDAGRLAMQWTSASGPPPHTSFLMFPDATGTTPHPMLQLVGDITLDCISTDELTYFELEALDRFQLVQDRHCGVVPTEGVLAGGAYVSASRYWNQDVSELIAIAPTHQVLAGPATPAAPVVGEASFDATFAFNPPVVLAGVRDPHILPVAADRTEPGVSFVARADGLTDRVVWLEGSELLSTTGCAPLPNTVGTLLPAISTDPDFRIIDQFPLDRLDDQAGTVTEIYSVASDGLYRLQDPGGSSPAWEQFTHVVPVGDEMHAAASGNPQQALLSGVTSLAHERRTVDDAVRDFLWVGTQRVTTPDGGSRSGGVHVFEIDPATGDLIEVARISRDSLPPLPGISVRDVLPGAALTELGIVLIDPLSTPGNAEPVEIFTRHAPTRDALLDLREEEQLSPGEPSVYPPVPIGRAGDTMFVQTPDSRFLEVIIERGDIDVALPVVIERLMIDRNPVSMGIELAVEDEAGTVLHRFPNPIALGVSDFEQPDPANPVTRTFQELFDTSLVGPSADPYVARARLVDLESGTSLNTATDTFSVTDEVATDAIVGAVNAEPYSLIPGETVDITSRVENTSRVTPYTDLTVLLSVLAPSTGDLVTSFSYPIESIAAGTAHDHHEFIELDTTYVPGVYTVEQVVLHNGIDVGEGASDTFEVQDLMPDGMALTGSLSIVPPLIAAGVSDCADMAAVITAANVSNTDLTDVTLTFSIPADAPRIAAARSVVIGPLDLPAGMLVEYDIPFNGCLDAGPPSLEDPVNAQLDATYSGGGPSRVLARANYYVADTTGVGAPVPNYVVVELGELAGGTDSEASALNDAGAVVGRTLGHTTDAAERAALWSCGAWTDVGDVVDVTTSTTATSIAADGAIVGYKGPGDVTNDIPFLHFDAVTTLFGTGQAHAVTGGASTRIAVGSTAGSVAAQWTQGSSGFTEQTFPLTDVDTSNLLSVSAFGTSVGTGTTLSGTIGDVALFVEVGEATYLAPSTNDGARFLTGINDQGVACGTLDDAAGFRPILQFGDVSIDLPMGGDWSTPQVHAINGAQACVGSLLKDSTGERHATVWRGGARFNLNDAVINGDGLITDAADVNESGQIAATVDDGTNTSAVLLDPVPFTDAYITNEIAAWFRSDASIEFNEHGRIKVWDSLVGGGAAMTGAAGASLDAPRIQPSSGCCGWPFIEGPLATSALSIPSAYAVLSVLDTDSAPIDTDILKATDGTTNAWSIRVIDTGQGARGLVFAPEGGAEYQMGLVGSGPVVLGVETTGSEFRVTINGVVVLSGEPDQVTTVADRIEVEGAALGELLIVSEAEVEPAQAYLQRRFTTLEDTALARPLIRWRSDTGIIAETNGDVTLWLSSGRVPYELEGSSTERPTLQTSGVVCRQAVRFDGVEDFLVASGGSAVDAMLVLDRSGSMNDPAYTVDPAESFVCVPGTITNPARIDAARQEILEFGQGVVADDAISSVSRVGIIGFSTAAEVLMGWHLKDPPPSEQSLEDEIRDSICGTVSGSTNYVPALQEALSAFTGGTVSGRRRVLIFLTDGEPNDAVPPAYPDAITALVDAGVTVFPIAFVADAGTAIAELDQMGATTYVDSGEQTGLQTVFDEIRAQIGDRPRTWSAQIVFDPTSATWTSAAPRLLAQFGDTTDGVSVWCHDDRLHVATFWGAGESWSAGYIEESIDVSNIDASTPHMLSLERVREGAASEVRIRLDAGDWIRLVGLAPSGVEMGRVLLGGVDATNPARTGPTGAETVGFFEGDVFEVVVHDRILSPTEGAEALALLDARYDILPDNTPPLVDAGDDIVAEDLGWDGIEPVSLSGVAADSETPTLDDSAFKWYLDGDQIAVGMNATAALPLGDNLVELRVTDPSGATGFARVLVQVVPLTTGIVGEWTFNGMSASDTKAADSSPNGFDLDRVYGTAAIVDGRSYEALDLFATTRFELDDPVIGTGMLPGGDAARTIAFWMAPDFDGCGYLDSPEGVVFAQEMPGSDSGAFVIRARRACVNVEINGERWGAVGLGLSSTEWHHVAVVVPEGAQYASQVLFYVNGVLQSTTPRGGGIALIDTVRDTASFGSAGAPLTSRFLGGLDECRMWARALTHSEILADFERPPAMLWRFGEGTGTSSVDTTVLSGGTPINLNGAASWGSGHPFALDASGVHVTGSATCSTATLTPPQDQLTLSFWFKADVKLPDNPEPALIWGTEQVLIGKQGAGAVIAGLTVSKAGPNLEDGNWHHIAVTRDDTSISVFLDGSLLVSADLPKFPPSPPAGAIQLVAPESNGVTYDDLRIDSRAVIKSEIQAIFNGQ